MCMHAYMYIFTMYMYNMVTCAYVLLYVNKCVCIHIYTGLASHIYIYMCIYMYISVYMHDVYVQYVYT